MRAIVLSALIGISGLAAVSPAQAESLRPQRYYAYCVYGKTTLSSNSPEQINTNYGSSGCMLSQSSSSSDPDRFLRNNYGGTGKPCSC